MPWERQSPDWPAAEQEPIAKFAVAGFPRVTRLSIIHKYRLGVCIENQYIPPYHALKHMAIDLPSLLKQAAGLRPVGERMISSGCIQTASAGLAGQ
ncbi:MAG: hypothetical protein ACYC1M_14925 [Armatimonadota bacterium]